MEHQDDQLPSMDAFTCKPIPRIYFGAGSFSQFLNQLPAYGKHLLLVLGKASFSQTDDYQKLMDAFKQHGLSFCQIHVLHEPEPDTIDQWVKLYREQPIDCVLAIGGGSSLDVGKAVAGLLPYQASIYAFLEGVGQGQCFQGRKIPLILVPTTAGTGSESTTNAVIGLNGQNGFKKSFRHDSLLPDVAIVDPSLMVTCPQHVMFTCAMDALTHLIEAYLSPVSNPMTDAWAVSGLMAFSRGFNRFEQDKQAAYEGLAYASLLGGLCLTNAGLGLVHGLVPLLGAHYAIPHALGCSLLLAEVTRTNIEYLAKQAMNSPAMIKYAHVGCLLLQQDLMPMHACEELIERLCQWKKQYGELSLSDFSINQGDLLRLSQQASLRNNPIKLEPDQVREALIRCL